MSTSHHRPTEDADPQLRLVPDPHDDAADEGTAPGDGSTDEEITAGGGTDGRGDRADGAEDPADPEGGDDAGPPDGRWTVEHAREVLGRADGPAYHRMLTQLVRPSHSSVLQELAYSPSLSFHDPTCVVVDPEPTTIDTIELYARAAYPDFDRVLAAAFADPALDHLLTALVELMFDEGANVALVTNHGQIIDIALVIAALEAALLAPGRSFGVLGRTVALDDVAEHTNVLVSRMVATRQAFNVPAVQVLQNATRIFLTVPQTANRRRAKLDGDLVRANNIVMRHELEQRLSLGGQLLAMAASGSQDLALPKLMQKARHAWRQRRGDDPGETPTLHLQPLYDRTVTLMRSCRYVLPVAICLDPATPTCRIGAITRVASDDDCHRIMDWIALAHQEGTGIPTIYHWHEDDLLTHVRAFLNRSSP